MSECILITGASRGIGRELALLAASRGYSIVLTARSGDELACLAQVLRDRWSVRVDVFVCDLSQAGAAQGLFEQLTQKNIEITFLVNNAGFGAFGASEAIPLETLERMVTLNIMALTTLTQLCVVRMKARRRGRILNVASTGAFQPCPWLGVYGATKAYVLSYSEALAEELRGSGVTVTALCPGPTRTNFGRAAGLEENSPFDRLSASAKDVARYGLEAALCGETVAVEGFKNRLLIFFERFIARSLVRRVASRLLRAMQ